MIGTSPRAEGRASRPAPPGSRRGLHPTDSRPMTFEPPNPFNIADYFLDDRIREGMGGRIAIRSWRDGGGACGGSEDGSGAGGGSAVARSGADRDAAPAGSGGSLETTTYAGLQARANRFAHVLTRIGVRPEERVLIVLPDVPDFAAALFGAIKAGAVAVMVNCFLSPRRIREICDYARASAVVTDAPRLAALAGAFAAARRPPRVLALGANDGDAPTTATEPPADSPRRGPDRPPPDALRGADHDADRLLAAAPPAFDNFPSHPGDPAVWLFSGGTTGRPKGVVQSHASFANTTECYARGVLGCTASDVTISVPKLHFGYATGSNLFFPLAVGGSAVLFPERCTPDELFRQIARHRPTILVNVPTMVSRMVSHPGARDQDLSCLRVATSAGEALPPAVHARWNEVFGVELLDGLGTAEMWHVFISNRPGRVRPGTLGLAVPGFDVRLTDEDGRETPHGEVGRMRVRGGSLAHGYWQHPRRTREAFQGEWYVSGDMMTRDADGWFTYQGRADDLFKVSGRWFSPGEVEGCLLAHPGVAEAAVVGVADDEGLAAPVAFVVAAEARVDEEELRRHCLGRIESYKVPRSLHVESDLPRTHLGKVDRGALKRIALDRAGR